MQNGISQHQPGINSAQCTMAASSYKRDSRSSSSDIAVNDGGVTLQSYVQQQQCNAHTVSRKSNQIIRTASTYTIQQASTECSTCSCNKLQGHTQCGNANLQHLSNHVRRQPAYIPNFQLKSHVMKATAHIIHLSYHNAPSGGQ